MKGTVLIAPKLFIAKFFAGFYSHTLSVPKGAEDRRRRDTVMPIPDAVGRRLHIFIKRPFLSHRRSLH